MDYHLKNVVWCGPHRVIFCPPYQEVVAGKFPQEIEPTHLDCSKGAINLNKGKPN